jgi:membrane-associated protease RseP (regulator of RpoE activity)
MATMATTASMTAAARPLAVASRRRATTSRGATSTGVAIARARVSGSAASSPRPLVPRRLGRHASIASRLPALERGDAAVERLESATPSPSRAGSDGVRLANESLPRVCSSSVSSDPSSTPTTTRPPFIDLPPSVRRLLPPLGLAFGGAGVFGGGFALDGPASNLEAVAVLASIIFVHECGHFFAARSQNIHVSKFSVGFGPNLLSYQGPEVEYSLRAIPLGGFVAFPDDDPDCPYPEDDPDLLRNRPASDRALVVSAGVAANVAFALAILFAQVSTVGLVEQSYAPGVKVTSLLGTSAARDFGVRQGDVITAVNGEALLPDRNAVARVVDAVRKSGSEPVRFDVRRTAQLSAGDALTAPGVRVSAAAAAEVESLRIVVTPRLSPSGEGRIGAQLEANAEVSKRVARDPAEAARLASREFARLTKLVSASLFSLVSDFDKAKENVSGPIAIVGVGAEVMRTSDLTGLYQFASVININLAVVNILPLPALDGGFLLLIAIEAARGGKKLPTEVEQSITASGVLLLLGSGMFLILRDTLNLFNGK